MNYIDTHVYELFLSATQSREWLYHGMKWMSDSVSPETILAAGGLLIAYAVYKRHLHVASVITLSLGGAFTLGVLIKSFVMRARPEQGLVIVSGYSFPSNHAVIVSALATLLICIYARTIVSPRLRRVFIAACIIFAFFVAASRLYLGVHWFSDVVAGLLLGTFWTLVVFSITRRFL